MTKLNIELNNELENKKEINQVFLSQLLIESISAIRKAGLSDDLVDKVNLHIADSIGIAFAARKTTLFKSVYEAQYGMSGNGSAELIGGGQISALGAAFLNSALIHILDFDDIHDMARLHPSAIVLPAVLAACNLSNAGVSNERIIEAVAIGNEVICRLGLICAPQGNGPGSDWFLTQLFGYLAASIAAGIVLELSDQELISSLGLAYMQMAGGKEAGFGVGSNARAIYPAFAAQGGVQAAYLSKLGIVGPQGVFDGTANLFKLYIGSDLSEEKKNILLETKSWSMLNVDIKPWPSCRLSHPYIAASLSAAKELSYLEIKAIKVSVNSSAKKLCLPLEERCQPKTLQDAKYSVPFMTAYAFIYGQPSLSQFTDSVLEDELLISFARRIEIVEDLSDSPGHPPARIELTLESGEQHVFVFNLNDLLLTEDQYQYKFMDCLCFSGLSVEDVRADNVWKLLRSGKILEGLQELSEIIY